MIQDQNALSDIRADWKGVIALRDNLNTDAIAAFALSTLDGHYPRELANAAQNLPFIHACSVLTEALRALKQEGRISCNRRDLGALVNASATALPWHDHAEILRIVKDRNAVAHDGVLLDQDTCRSHVAAIHVELQKMGIVQ